MNNEEYRKHEGTSRSQLWQLKKSPLHFKHNLETPQEETTALLFGKAMHKYILEYDDFFNEFVVAPKFDKRTKAGKEAFEQWLEMAGGKTVIDEAMMEQINAMADVINENQFAKVLLTGDCEKSFFWTDEATGEKFKCRPDCLSNQTLNGKRLIVDYKTTDSCEDGHFERACKKYGYKLQAGMYREGMFQNTFEDYGFVFVAQEKKEPYAVRVYVCSEEFINEGLDEFRELAGLLHYCKSNDDWFGYEGANNNYTILSGEGESEND